MEPNPYAPGAIPAYLAGRRQQLALIEDTLSRVRALGRAGGPLLAFSAPRGLGKTSMLRQAQRDALQAGYVTAWVTGRDDEPMVPSLARELRASVEQLAPRSRAEGLLHRLDQVQVEFGVPGAKIAASTSPGQRDRPGEGLIEELLEDTARFAANHDSPGLALFVDEFQDARLEDRKSLLVALQHFDGDPRGCPVAVVAAGLPSLPGAVVESATFGERSTFEDLQLLSDVAVAEALRIPAQAAGVAWSDEAVQVAIDGAQGYPHLVQLIGAQTWQAVRPERGDELSEGAARAGLTAAERRMTMLYQSRLERSTPKQREFLEAMATEGDQRVRREAVARRLGVTSASLARPRDELISRGLIEADGHGTLRFTVPGFGAHVRGANASEVAGALGSGTTAGHRGPVESERPSPRPSRRHGPGRDDLGR